MVKRSDVCYNGRILDVIVGEVIDSKSMFGKMYPGCQCVWRSTFGK